MFHLGILFTDSFVLQSMSIVLTDAMICSAAQLEECLINVLTYNTPTSSW